MDAPAQALDFLSSNPHEWRSFQDKYGYLPDGFSPPAAPAPAVAMLQKDPALAGQFHSKYGYLPNELKANPTAPAAPAEAAPVDLTHPESLTDEPARFKEVYQQGGLGAVGKYLVSPSSKGEVGQAARGPAGAIEQAVTGEQGPLGDVSALASRSLARLGSGFFSMRELLDRYTGMDSSADAAAGVRKRFQDAEDGAMDALRPEVKAAVVQPFIDRAKDGSLEFGEGAKDPWWWTGTAIDTATQMAPGTGSAALSARVAYGARYAEALAKAGASKASVRVATRYAEREATKAAVKAAAIAGSGVEGYLAGSQSAQDVQKTIGQLDEESMMNYEPYRDLRQDGLSHEAARAKVADTQSFKAGLGVAVATGLTGAPLNGFIGRWAAGMPVAGGKIAGALKGAALEGTTEGLQEGSQQLIENLSQRPITGQDPWEGVLENALTGVAVGGVFGSAEGAVGGHVAPEKPETPTTRILQQRVKDYNAARDNLANAQGSAADPNIPMTQDDLQAAREQYQQAHVALAQELLKSGNLDKEGQQQVAAALEEAKKSGVEIPESTTDVDEKQLSKADEVGAGQTPTAGAAKPAAASGGAPVSAAAGKAAQAPELNETQSARLDVLKKVANAEPLSMEELTPLVSEKLAKVNPGTGRPLLLPAGLRMRKQLDEIVSKAEAAKVAAKADTKTEKAQDTKTEKPSGPATESAAPGYSENETASGEQKPAKKALGRAEQQEDAYDAQEGVNRLRPDDYGTLERIASGKPVDAKEAARLLDVGLVNPRDDGKFVMRPQGRRELKAFKETRQTALERSYEPVVEADTLHLPEKNAERKKANQQLMAEQARAAERREESAARNAAKAKKAEQAAAIRKTREEAEAVAQKGDQNIATELAKVKDPNDAMAVALMQARAKARTDTASFPDEGGPGKPQRRPNPDNIKRHAFAMVEDHEFPIGNPNMTLHNDDGKWSIHADGKPLFGYDKEADAREDFKSFQTDPKMARKVALSMRGARAKTLRFRHFSNLNEDEVTLDPKYQGTGIPGMERRRGGAKVTSLYAEDHPDESIEPGLKGRTEYSVEVPSKEIYDANADPKGFIAQASEGGQFDMSEFEALVKQAGFKGYHTPQAEGLLRGQGRLFGPVKAKRRSAVAAHRLSDAMRNAPLSVERVKAATAQISSHLGIPIKVVSSHLEYPADVQGIPGVEKSAGMWYSTPLGGDIYLNAARTRSDYDAQVNAIHEIVGHWGLRGVLGDRYIEVMRDIARAFPEEVRAAAAQNRIPLVGGTRAEILANHWAAAEELVAYATEKVLAKDIEAKQGVWAKIVGFVRDALRKIGLVSGFTTNDIETLIHRSRDYVRSGRAERMRSRDARANAAGQPGFTPNYTPLDYGQPLSGMPTEGAGRPFEVARAAARRYVKRAGMNYRPPTSFMKVNEERAKRIAQAYDQMKHDPTDPKVKESYDAMIRETLAQYQVIKETGLKVEFLSDGQKDPYAASPRLAIKDVQDNNHLWVFPTDQGYGSDGAQAGDHPMLAPTDEYIGDRRLLANDVFRVVHDYFGHIKEGVGFRANGEENAWRQHAAMYSPVARGAMTSETRGQNSWVNHGPRAEQNRGASGASTIYADQKAGLLPDEFSSLDEEQADEMENAFSVPTEKSVKLTQSLHAELYASEVDTLDDDSPPGKHALAAQLQAGKSISGEALRYLQNNFEYHIDRLQDQVDSGDPSDRARNRNLIKSMRKLQSDLREAALTMGPNLGKAGQFLTEDERALLRTGTAQKMVDIFKDLPSDAEMASVALAGQAKRGWYKKSAQAISDVFGPDAPRFTALLAALSPQTSVESNLRNAINVWTAWVKAGRPTGRGAIFKIMGENVEGSGGKLSVLPAWIPNSVRALTDPNPETITLSGPKVNSFAANLRGATHEVTLDTWMANYALVDQTLFGGAKRLNEAGEKIGGKGPGYLAYAARVRQAADRLTKMTGETWTPAEVQETVWSWAKALTELTESYGHLGSAREIIESKELTDELINATPDFANLFQQPEYAGALARGGYGEQVGRLSEGSLAGVASEASPASTTAGQDRHLSAAAGRLDKLIEKRREAKEETRQSAFSMGGINTGGDKQLESFLSKIGAKPKTLKQRWDEATANLLDRANMGLFDHFYGIKRAETMAGISAGDSGYISARLSAGAAGLMRSVLERGHPVWDDGAPNTAGDHGFFDIIKPLGDNVNSWLAWMVARRAERLHSEGREHLFSPGEIAAAKKLGDNNPAFQQAAKEYADFKSKILDFAEEAGIINPDTRHVWDNADHIPFYRLMENGEINVKGVGGGIGYVKNQIHKLKGGEQNLGDPLENIMKNWSNMLEASLKAHAARLTVDNLNGTGLVTTVNQQKFTPAGLDQFKKNFPQLVADLKTIGIDVDTLTPEAFRGVQSMLARSADEEGTVSVWRNGQKESWMVHDPLLFRSLQAIHPDSWGPWMKLFRAPKRFLTETVTLVPEFAVKNIWRDMWSVFVQGTTDKRAIPIIPLLDTAKGAIEMLKKGDTAHSMAAGGASFEGTGFNTQDAAESARRAARRGGVTHGIIDTPAKAYLLYRDLLSAAENAHRVVLYNKALATGKSRKEALYEARDVMDFSLRGNSPLMRFLVETVPFLGARVAGLSTLGRRFAADPKGIAIRGLLLVAASLAYVWANHDDDRYKGLTDDQKNNYWHFFDVFQKDDHIRVPKPFEVGTIFSTIPEVAMDTMLTNKDEPDKYKQALGVVGHAFANTLDLSPKVQTVWPVFELAINENTFTGAPILNIGDKGVLPQEQDSPSVRPTYRYISQHMPEFAPDAFRSPKQLQHLGQGYMGGLQDYVFAVTDRIASAAMGEPAPAAKDFGDRLFFKSFYDQGPARNTKYTNSLYKTADAADQVYRSINKAGSDERVDQLLDEKEDLLAARKPFSKAVDKLSDLRKQQRAIQLSDTDPVEKKQMSNEIDEAANEIARDLWDLRPGGKLSPSVAEKLMNATKRDQVKTLRDNGMPATAGLVESLPRTAPSNLSAQ